MNAAKKQADILRGAATHAQPRHLPRAPRHGAPTSVATSIESEAGFQRGLEEGRAVGLREGLAGAQQRVEESMRSARQEFEQAARQRLQDFQSEAAARLAQLDRLLAGFESAAARRVAELEEDAIALAYGAVCKLIGEQSGSAEAVASSVRQATAQLRAGTLLAVRMNEIDLRTLLADEPGRRVREATPLVKWVADPAVALGGCLLETTSGSLDARLETQLASLRTLWATRHRQTESPA